MNKVSFAHNVKDGIAVNVREYFNDTTVHGFRYVVQGRNRFERIFWFLLIITGFVFSSDIIYRALFEWNKTPLQTTIEKVDVPVQEYPFPAVTICDPEQLQVPRRNRWLFLEQLLNWVDLESFESAKNASPSDMPKGTFQLNSIRSAIASAVESHFYKPFKKATGGAA